MKKIVVLGLFILLSASMSLAIFQRKDININLLFLDVEALAQGESGSVRCWVNCGIWARIECTISPCEAGPDYVICQGVKTSC